MIGNTGCNHASSASSFWAEGVQLSALTSTSADGSIDTSVNVQLTSCSRLQSSWPTASFKQLLLLLTVSIHHLALREVKVVCYLYYFWVFEVILDAWLKRRHSGNVCSVSVKVSESVSFSMCVMAAVLLKEVVFSDGVLMLFIKLSAFYLLTETLFLFLTVNWNVLALLSVRFEVCLSVFSLMLVCSAALIPPLLFHLHVSAGVGSDSGRLRLREICCFISSSWSIYSTLESKINPLKLFIHVLLVSLLFIHPSLCPGLFLISCSCLSH